MNAIAKLVDIPHFVVKSWYMSFGDISPEYMYLDKWLVLKFKSEFLSWNGKLFSVDTSTTFVYIITQLNRIQYEQLNLSFRTVIK